MDLRFAIDIEADPGPEEEVGITIWRNHSYHYQLLLTTRDGERVALWRRRVADLCQEECIAVPTGVLRLLIESDHARYSAHVQAGDERHTVGSGTPRLLATELAGGFIGTVIALTATGPDPARHADVARVDYEVLRP